MDYPRIFLAIDNCFAYKRWTTPLEWATVIRNLGVQYVEASSDTELDPLYMGEDYLLQWIKDVKAAEKSTGVQVANLYSGHGTYTTLGLTHTSESVRERLKNQWFKPLIKVAADLGAGVGFFAHAFSDAALNSSQTYDSCKQILFDNLIELNDFAESAGCGLMGLEQMYAPHHYPWRIKDVKELLQHVSGKSKRGFYFTEDVGHHHTNFLRPQNLEEKVNKSLRTGETSGLWLGTKEAYALYDKIIAQGKAGDEIGQLQKLVDESPYLFSQPQDCDCYEWLRQLGAYSPIIHLQQTDGNTSAHWPFTQSYNKRGIIRPLDVLKALRQSYDAAEEMQMPQRVHKIYLTLEVFTSTASINNDTIKNLEESVRYWRSCIVEDGMRLDEIIAMGEEKGA